MTRGPESESDTATVGDLESRIGLILSVSVTPLCLNQSIFDGEKPMAWREARESESESEGRRR